MWMTLIRTAVISAVTGLTTTGARVFDQEPYDLADLPCLIVSTGTPSIDVSAIDDTHTLQVDTEIRIESVAQVSTGAAALHDVIAAEIMVAMGGQVTVQSVARPVALMGIEFAELSGDGDRPVSRRVMTFVCTPLFVRANAPATLI